MVTETNGEMVKYRNRSQAQFLPVEIYNDEKRQYIIEQLTNINCPFVEEDTTIYVPDYYEKSVLKAAAAFKPMNNQTVRDRLKFYIDRLIYSANSFDELLSLLEKQGYAIVTELSSSIVFTNSAKVTTNLLSARKADSTASSYQNG